MMKLRKLWLNKFFKNYFIILVSFLLLEIIFRFIAGLSKFSYQGLRIFVGLNILALILGFILSFLPKLITKIFNLLLVLITSIYGIVQLGFNNFLGVYMSIETKSQASAVASYVGDFILSFKWFYYILLVPFILLFIYYIFIDKKLDLDLPKRKLNFKLWIFNILKIFLILLLSAGYYLTLKLDFMQNKLQHVSTYNLFKKPSIPSLVINEFGFIGFGILDIKDYFFPSSAESFEVNYDPDSILENNNVSYDDQIIIDNEVWQEIIEGETNQKYNTLNKYFISNKISKTNEYTGMFENKNLIVIMLESGSNIMLNEDYYPYLSKLYNEGYLWNNNYSPRNSCATGNNEMSGMLGLYSINNNCTTNVYKRNTYFESIFNLFNENGYYTNSFHNHTDAYYYRTMIHKNMGSQKFYKIQDMDITYNTRYGQWVSDEDLMNFYLKTLDEREDDVPFMSWITTVSAHQPYSNSTGDNDTYIDLFSEELPKDVRRYMSKLKVVDNALGILLNGLEERDLLNDTVIVLYADHYPYAISTDNLNTVLEYDTSIDKNADRVPFIIYNPSLDGKYFEEYTSYVNITPTIANLFGLKYDSRLYLGSDILSKDYNSLVVFADGSWKNEIAYYNASTGSIKYYTNKVYNDEEILAINEEISLKLNISSLAIKSNYFSYLNNKLSNYYSTSDS